MKVISAVVGAVLLLSAVILSFISSSSGERMMAKQSAMVTKYVEASKESLDNGDIEKAIKMAKFAIGADPKSKAAFRSYESALETKFKPAPSDDWGAATGGSNDWSTTQEAPASEEAEDDEMGC